MYKLHYAKLDLGMNDIPCFEFRDINQLIDFIDDKCLGRSGQLVWLIAKDKMEDIFISENHLSIQSFIENTYLWKTQGTFFLQEYRSYEEAYQVALDMKEESPLCYDDNYLNN